MNYHHGFNLTAEACTAPAVQNVANVFLTTVNRSAVRQSVMIEKRLPLVKDLREYSEHTIGLLNPSDRNRVIGIEYFKYCATRHKTLQLERLGAVAFTCHDEMKFDIHPNSLRTEAGVGQAKSVLATRYKFEPVIDFALLPNEATDYPATKVAEAAVSRPGNRAYIALRGLEQVFVIR